MEQLETWQMVVLAVVQGLTEFLPISSSGHLVIVAAWFGGGEKELDVSDVNIVLHVGTLCSILVFYWYRVWRLIGEDRRAVVLLAIGTLPAVVVGVPLKLWFEQVLESPLLAGCMLLVTGAILLAAARCRRGEGEYLRLGFGQALLIGGAQAVAILPGISRSGATIAMGLRLGLSPKSAATFSFLLAIPAIGGAGLLELKSLLGDAQHATPPLDLAAGAVVSFIVGLASLWWLVRWLERGRFQLFAWWCIPLGLGVIVWQLFLLRG